MSTLPDQPATEPRPVPDTPALQSPHAPIFHTLDRTASYPYAKREYARRILWNLVRRTLFRWSLPRAFTWRRWLLRRFGAVIGENPYVRKGVWIWHPWLLEIGDWTAIADEVVIYNLGPVHIGNH